MKLLHFFTLVSLYTFVISAQASLIGLRYDVAPLVIGQTYDSGICSDCPLIPGGSFSSTDSIEGYFIFNSDIEFPVLRPGDGQALNRYDDVADEYSFGIGSWLFNSNDPLVNASVTVDTTTRDQGGISLFIGARFSREIELRNGSDELIGATEESLTYLANYSWHSNEEGGLVFGSAQYWVSGFTGTGNEWRLRDGQEPKVDNYTNGNYRRFAADCAGTDDCSGFYGEFPDKAVSPPTSVPEPSVIALFGLGLVGIGFARRRRQS